MPIVNLFTHPKSLEGFPEKSKTPLNPEPIYLTPAPKDNPN